MSIEKDIKQKSFKDNYAKAYVNILFSSLWAETMHSRGLKNFGLTVPQFHVLIVVQDNHPKPVTVNQIAELMLDRASNVSRIVDMLEKKNILIRNPSQLDKRSMEIVLTEKAKAIIAKIDEMNNRVHERFPSLSINDTIKLNNLLNKIRSF